jgi:hypothetical protein
MTGEMLTVERATPGHTTLPIGSLRMRFHVAAKIASHTAGAITGVAGSPTPRGISVLGTMTAEFNCRCKE